MNLDFSADDQRFRDEVRTWLEEQKPRAARPTDGPEMRAFDLEWQARQYQAGWAGIAWPRQYGGRGLSIVQQLIWYEEYAHAEAPFVGVNYIGLNHGGPTLIACGDEAQKAFYLSKILKGETPWCQGFSEPGAGSDLASLRTRGVVDGDYLVVTGSKIWSSLAQFGDYQELLVRTDPGAPKHKGLSWVIGDMRLPGVEVRPIRCMDGIEHFCEVFYDEVRIPLANLVGPLNGGWGVAMATLGFERGTAMLADQIELSRVVDTLIEAARALPGPDGRRPALLDDEIGARLADLRAEVMALKAMSYAAVSRALHEDVPGAESVMIALNFGELYQRVYAAALEVFGAESLTLDGASRPWSSTYLYSFMQTIAGGTSEIRRNIIGERVLGLPRGS